MAAKDGIWGIWHGEMALWGSEGCSESIGSKCVFLAYVRNPCPNDICQKRAFYCLYLLLFSSSAISRFSFASSSADMGLGSSSA